MSNNISFFVIGIFLMAVVDGVDVVFGIGLLFFIIGLTIMIFQITWRVAGSADGFVRRHLKQFTL